ncbi:MULTISPECIES: helix-turn-helix domain-containing protein [Paenibacillus]|uniref:helix-turn-helix domain-containing protein n=1 Tax=Paenibacillus TaxID=44249 RepID=UPI00215AD861|nr:MULTISPECIES: helix-turn-helix transcriptional regulator [Paenibacillus]
MFFTKGVCDLYEKFLVLLEQYGKTPYQVSKDTGVSTATLTNWKQGRYKPKTDKLKILADYFGVTVDYFLS